jgi:hypothetical protein
MRNKSEGRGQAREEEEDGKAKSGTSARRVVLKGRMRPLTFNDGPVVSVRLSPTRAHPSETTAHSRDASVPVE